MTRLHYLDRSRAVLMLLGIPYHSAMMFAYNWGPPQNASSPFLRDLTQTLTMFRMPAFFLIAGLFTGMMLQRRMSADWLRERSIRLGVPLLSATLVIIPLQMLIFAANASPTVRATGVTWANELLTPSLGWISHLWFLYDLMLYSMAAVLAWPMLRRIATMRMPRLVTSSPVPVLLVVMVVLLAPVALVTPVLQQGVIGPVAVRLVHNGMFFVLGIALIQQRALLDGWLSWRANRAAASVIVVALGAALTLGGHHERLGLLAGPAAALGGTWLVLAAMKRWSDAPHPTVSFFVDASLTIYLVHHPIILALGMITARTGFAPEVEWFAVVVITGFLSAGFYALLCRVPPLYFLLNGRPLRPCPVPAGSAGSAVSAGA